MKKLWVPLVLAFVGCTSMNQASRRYFYLDKTIVGVEAPGQVIMRIEDHPAMTHILYGDIKVSKLIECIFLRNQLYVAALSGVSKSDWQPIKSVALMVEQGFQESDHSFLSACDKAFAAPELRPFFDAQKEFIRGLR